MIDIDSVSTCRICLNDGAIYPIFERNEEFDSVFAKLAVCIREKLENIEGYPTNICLECKNTSDNICEFVSKFEETCKILERKIVVVKTENLESVEGNDNDNNDPEPFYYDLQIDYLPPASVKPKAEKRNATELLEALKHLTVKRIKVGNDLDEGDVETDSGETTSNDLLVESTTKKKGQAKKTPVSSQKASAKNRKPTAAKKAVSKSAGKKPVAKPVGKEDIEKPIRKKASAKPIVEKKNGVCKPSETSSPKTKDMDHEKDLRPGDDKGNHTRKSQMAPDTPVLCHHCGEMVKAKCLLKDHILKMHTEKRFKCTKCPNKYRNKGSLKEHLERHENIRNHICETCSKAFIHRKNLISHIRVVHNKIKQIHPSFKCRFCDRTFLSRRCFVIHERSVHTGERPEVCSVCDGRFYDKVYLKEHMRIHTGEAIINCPVCGRGYTQRGNMKSHLRNHRVSELTPDLRAKIRPNYLRFMKP